MPPTITFFTDPDLVPAYARLRYLLDALQSHPNAPAQLRCLLNPDTVPLGSLVCHYGARENAAANAFVIPAQRLFLLAQPTVRQTVVSNVYAQEGRHLYGVAARSENPGQALLADGAFRFDWLETLFFHWSRWEEYAPAPQDLDEIGRMKSSAQLLPRHGLHHIPVVDQLVTAIFQALGFPETRRPTIFSLSHDVDALHLFGPGFRMLRYLGGVALRHRSLRAWPRIVSDYRQVRKGQIPDPGDTFDWLLRLGPDLEKTIYFGMENHSPYDHFPDLDHPRLLEVRDMARAAGYQTGIHPSFNTWKDADLMLQEHRRAEQWLAAPVVRSRQHYLHFAFPETADILEKTGIKEDATLGFRDRIGFRAGTGFSFHLYSFSSERAYRWVEKPLVAMDAGLVKEGGRHTKDIRKHWSDFIALNPYGTAISMNLHNTYPYEQGLHGLDFRVLFGSLLSQQKEPV